MSETVMSADSLDERPKTPRINPEDVLRVVRVNVSRESSCEEILDSNTEEREDLVDEPGEAKKTDSYREMTRHRTTTRHHKRQRSSGTTQASQLPANVPNYWTLPRKTSIDSIKVVKKGLLNQTSSLLSQNSGGSADGANTPGAIFLQRNHNKTPTSRIYNPFPPATRNTNSPSQYDLEYKHEIDLPHQDDCSSSTTHSNKSQQHCRSELRSNCSSDNVYFRFDRGDRQKKSAAFDCKQALPSDLFLSNSSNRPDLLVQLQSHCRAWLARQEFKRRQLTAREIARLKTRIALYRAAIKALKAENSAYDAKLKSLSQSLLKTDFEDLNSLASWKSLANQLSLALHEHQSRWGQALELHASPLEGDDSDQEFENCIEVIGKKPPTTAASFNIAGTGFTTEDLDHPSSPPSSTTGGMPLSLSQELAVLGSVQLRKHKHSSPSLHTESGIASLDRARDDVEFYRNQVELLREEADEFHTFANMHYEEKIIILSDRVEHLQNQLTHLTHKNERLARELEEANQVAADSKMCERSLQIIVDQLSRQLAEYRDQPRPQDDDLTEQVSHETLSRLENCRNYIERVREYFAGSPRTMQNTIFAPGAEFDIFAKCLGPSMDSEAVSRILAACNGSPVRGGKLSRLDSSPGSMNSLLSPSMYEASMRKSLEEMQQKMSELQHKLDTEIEDREAVEIEMTEMRNKNSSLQRQLKRVREEMDEELAMMETGYLRRLRELQDQLEDETRLREESEQAAKSLEHKFSQMRRSSELSEFESIKKVTEAWQETEMKLRSDVKYYKRSLELVQEEFDQFKTKFDPEACKREIDERDERLHTVEHEKQQMRVDLDINAIKLQNTSSLLEDTENRLRVITKERNSIMQRMSQLESERDDAIREAANATGKAGAVHEASQARSREVNELRNERDCLKRELNDLRVELTRIQVDSASEIALLKARNKELDRQSSGLRDDYEVEMDKLKEDIETMQSELKLAQGNELALKSNNRMLKRQLDEAEDQASVNIRKITEFERLCADLCAERDRAKADLTATRETASILKANNRRRMDEECGLGLRVNSVDTLSDEHDLDDFQQNPNVRRSNVFSPDRHSNSNSSVTNSNSRTEHLLRRADEMTLEASASRYHMGSFEFISNMPPPASAAATPTANQQTHPSTKLNT